MNLIAGLIVFKTEVISTEKHCRYKLFYHIFFVNFVPESNLWDIAKIIVHFI